MDDKLLKVSEVADILRVSQMTVIRKCRDGSLPFIRVGSMRRIREIDLEYYILNPNKKPKAPETERPVYDGPPAYLNGFDSEEDEIARRKALTEQCAKLGRMIETDRAKKVVKVPEPPIRIGDGMGTGLFPSGFAEIFEDEEYP